MDVDGQRLQRRDVDDLGDALHALPAGGGAVQLVDRGEEAGQGLARACGGGDQGDSRAAMCGQPSACAGVGPSGNRASNHARTAGWRRLIEAR